MKRKYTACKNKRGHETYLDALKQSKYLLATKNIITRVYRCRSCGKYHIGKISYFFNNAIFYHNMQQRDTSGGLERYKRNLERK